MEVTRPMGHAQPLTQLLAYCGSFCNLGDAIQTIAMTWLLGREVDYVFRDRASTADPTRLFVVNGYLCDYSIPVDGSNSLFSGVHLGMRHARQMEWIRKSRFPVAARDPYTQQLLKDNGIKSELIGCATLTFPRYEGERRNIYSIDTKSGGGLPLTQHFPYLAWQEQLALAAQRLDTLRTATLVHTTRLHVALPCLAMGTPVCVYPTRNQPERLSILETLGVEYGKTTVMDCSGIADVYKSFVARYAY